MMQEEKKNINPSKELKITERRKPVKLNFEPHPNYIFGVKVEKNKTPGGIILPETKKDLTPIVELVAVGANIEHWKEGDVVYADPNFMNFAQIDGVTTIVLMADGIFGKIPKNENDV